MLNGKLGQCQLIKTITLNSTTAQAQLDLSDIDWNEWEWVAIMLENTPGMSTEYFTCRLYDEDGKVLSAYCGNDNTAIAHFGSGPFLLVFFPWHNESNSIRAVSLAETSGFGYSAALFSQLKAVYVARFASDYYFSSDDQFTVYGIR